MNYTRVSPRVVTDPAMWIRICLADKVLRIFILLFSKPSDISFWKSLSLNGTSVLKEYTD